MQNKHGFLAVMVMALVSTALASVAGANDGGWEPTVGVGGQVPDEDRGLEDSSEMKYLGLGYFLTNEVMLEVYGADHNAKTDLTGSKVDSSQIGLKALYHFGTSRPGIIPYLALGLNEISFDPDAATGGESETGIMVGAGIKTYFTERFSLRMELNNTRYQESKDHDSQLWIGFSYLFGGNSHAAMAEETEVVVQAVAPVAVVAVAPVDGDGDGVYDNADQCPTTAAGRVIDEKGCETVVRENVLREKVSIKVNVLFDTNKSTFKADATSEIKRVADFMAEYPTTKVVIEGHTDSSGSNELNKSLSEARAKVVAETLVRDYAIDASRVSSVGYGEDRPLAENSTAEGRSQNRRVTAEIEEVVVVSP